jgi:hypothetical protein
MDAVPGPKLLGLIIRRANVQSWDGQILQPPYNSSDPFRYRILTHVQLSHPFQSLVSLLEEPIAGGEMSTIPAKTIERNRDNPDGRIHVCAPPANHTYDSEEVRCFALGDRT